MGYKTEALQLIKQLASEGGFKKIGKYATKFNERAAIETTFINANGVEMKVIKDATSGKAIKKTVANTEGIFTRTYLGSGNGSVAYNDCFRTLDGTVLRDVDHQKIWFSRDVKHNGKFVKDWRATVVHNTKKEAFLDKNNNVVGYYSNYNAIPYESLEPGNAKISEMLPALQGVRTSNPRGITLSEIGPYKSGNIMFSHEDGRKYLLGEHYNSISDLSKITGDLHQWTALW